MRTQTRSRLLASLATVMALGASVALAEPIAIENFDTAPVGATAIDTGWTSLDPAAAITSWVIRDDKTSLPGLPDTPAGNNSKTLVQQADGGHTTMAKPFPRGTRLPTDGVVYYSIRLVPYLTGNSVHQLRVGAVCGHAHYMVPVFGIDGNTGGNVYFTIWTRGKPYVQTRSTLSYDPEQWYEVVCALDLRGPGSLKASLYVRNLTQGETSLHPIQGLQGISPDFGPDTAPDTWTAWAIHGSYRQEIDNLCLTTKWDGLSLP